MAADGAERKHARRADHNASLKTLAKTKKADRYFASIRVYRQSERVVCERICVESGAEQKNSAVATKVRRRMRVDQDEQRKQRCKAECRAQTAVYCMQQRKIRISGRVERLLDCCSHLRLANL